MLSLRKIAFILYFIINPVANLLFSQSTKIYRSLESLKNVPVDSVFAIDLSKKKLKEFPEELSKFYRLKYLKLYGNRLKNFPEVICNFSQLEYLDLSKNPLDSIPPCIGKLRHLKELVLNRTEIDQLPKEIAFVDSLEVLDVWGTNLAFLPPEISRLKKLRVLDMRVIAMNRKEQEIIRQLLPNTEIKFSKPCNCGF
ncbi:MAG: hypothetical protein KatS3mg034_1555 [Vicingaceae bacterium]|nr:MAG: hypothetical protein KatS3mg034_1555 [Vicingaceae bacterium]